MLKLFLAGSYILQKNVQIVTIKVNIIAQTHLLYLELQYQVHQPYAEATASERLLVTCMTVVMTKV